MQPFKPNDTDSIEVELRKQSERGYDRVKATGEVFTPMALARKMVAKLPLEKKQDPNSTYLDPSCGDGNFLVALLEDLCQYHDPYWVVNHMVYGVDLMLDNVETAKVRLGLTPDQPGWFHIVCADALEYDYEFPCPFPGWTG
jgi:type I restriction-modification system DNA methylase subunit